MTLRTGPVQGSRHHTHTDTVWETYFLDGPWVWEERRTIQSLVSSSSLLLPLWQEDYCCRRSWVANGWEEKDGVVCTDRTQTCIYFINLALIYSGVPLRKQESTRGLKIIPWIKDSDGERKDAILAQRASQTTGVVWKVLESFTVRFGEEMETVPQTDVENTFLQHQVIKSCWK